MALTSKGFYANVQVADAAGNVTTRQYEVVGADIATAKTNAATLVSALDAVTDGLIIGYSVGEQFYEDTDTYGAAGSEVENLAVLSVELESEKKKATLTIPAPIDAIFVDTTGPNRNVVDLTNANLITFMNNFTDETGYTAPGPDAIALISDGEKIAPDNTNDVPKMLKGRRGHRASRKG